MFNLKFALIAVLAIGGFLYHDKLGWDLAKKRKAEAAVLTATLETERANRKTEQDDRSKADASTISTQGELATISEPKPAVRVYCRPAIMPSATVESAATAVTDAATAGEGPEGALRSVGDLLEAVRVEQQSNAARQRALIEWEQNRTH